MKVATTIGKEVVEPLFGGWRIVKTMGKKITKMKPFEGFCAETAGARKGVSAVKWRVTTNILWAWILTTPVSAIIGGVTNYKTTSNTDSELQQLY